MANVCLIYPRDINLNFFPLGLGYIASFLKKNGHKVVFLDLSENDLPILNDRRLEQIDIFGLSITTPQLRMAEKIIKILKRNYPGKPIMAGGIHPSFFKGEFLKQYDIDFVINGEGEITTNELCQALDRGIKDFSHIDGLIFKKDGQIIETKSRELIKNLDELPFPARDLVNYETYLQPPGLIRGIWTRRSANLTTSRGCPGRCTYCGVNYIYNKCYRRRSVDNVLAEIDLLVNDYNIDALYFMDDTFLMTPSWVKEFAQKFIARGYKIKWSCYGRVDTVNEEILKAVKQAGCVQVEYGIEAGSPRVLKSIKKNTNIEGIKQAISMTKKIGLRALGSFIFGFIEDTEEDLKENIKLAKELQLDFTVAYFATPYPASEIYERAVAENRIIEPDLSKWYIRNNNIWRVNLDKDVISRYRDEFMKSVRWNNLMFFLKKPSLLVNVGLLMLKNIDAVYKAIKEAIKMHSFDDLGYYFYVYLSKNLKNRNFINLK